MPKAPREKARGTEGKRNRKRQGFGQVHVCQSSHAGMWFVLGSSRRACPHKPSMRAGAVSKSRPRTALVESAGTAQSTDTAKTPQEKTTKRRSGPSSGRPGS